MLQHFAAATLLASALEAEGLRPILREQTNAENAIEGKADLLRQDSSKSDVTTKHK